MRLPRNSRRPSISVAVGVSSEGESNSRGWLPSRALTLGTVALFAPPPPGRAMAARPFWKLVCDSKFLNCVIHASSGSSWKCTSMIFEFSSRMTACSSASALTFCITSMRTSWSTRSRSLTYLRASVERSFTIMVDGKMPDSKVRPSSSFWTSISFATRVGDTNSLSMYSSISSAVTVPSPMQVSRATTCSCTIRILAYAPCFSAEASIAARRYLATVPSATETSPRCCRVTCARVVRPSTRALRSSA